MKPEWFDNWTAVKDPIYPHLIELYQSLPPFARKLILKFPHNCVIKINTFDHCLPVNTYCVVQGYLEPDSLLIKFDNEEYFIYPDDVKIMGYWNGLDKKRMREILGD